MANLRVGCDFPVSCARLLFRETGIKLCRFSCRWGYTQPTSQVMRQSRSLSKIHKRWNQPKLCVTNVVNQNILNVRCYFYNGNLFDHIVGELSLHSNFAKKSEKSKSEQDLQKKGKTQENESFLCKWVGDYQEDVTSNCLPPDLGACKSCEHTSVWTKMQKLRSFIGLNKDGDFSPQSESRLTRDLMIRDLFIRSQKNLRNLSFSVRKLIIEKPKRWMSNGIIWEFFPPTPPFWEPL